MIAPLNLCTQTHLMEKPMLAPHHNSCAFLNVSLFLFLTSEF